MSPQIILFAFIASALATSVEKVARDACNPCSPKGATGSDPPAVGPDLSSLYTDVLASVKDIHFDVRSADSVEVRADGFCCAETLDCVNVQNLNIPMCYDKFTTNFAFTDRSYGSLTTGDYSQGESKVNLFTGQYSKDGSEANIYSEDPAAKPNTATLSIPPQWTEAGVGSAIPPTEIVGSVTASAQTTATASEQTSGQTSATSGTAESQSTGSATSGAAAASATSTPGAAVKGTPSLIIMGLAALFYGV